MVIWVKFTHSRPFEFTDSQNVNVHSCHLLFDHLQFALIHGPDIPGSYAILLFTALTLLPSPVTAIAGYCFCFGSIPSFFLELFLHWSPVAYWVLTDLGSTSFSILSFCFSYCPWGFQGKNTEVVCHSLLQWTTFYQTSPQWPAHPGWPHTAWLIFIEFDKAWSMWLDWLAFCDYGFSVSALWCPFPTPTILLGFLLPWTYGISP